MKNKKFYIAIGLILLVAGIFIFSNKISSTEFLGFLGLIATGFGLAHTVTDLKKK